MLRTNGTHYSNQKEKSFYQRLTAIGILFASVFMIHSLSAEEASAFAVYTWGTDSNGCRWKHTDWYDDNTGTWTSGFTEYMPCNSAIAAPTLEEVNGYDLIFTDESGEEIELEPEVEAEVRYNLYLDLVELAEAEIE